MPGGGIPGGGTEKSMFSITFLENTRLSEVITEMGAGAAGVSLAAVVTGGFPIVGGGTVRLRMVGRRLGGPAVGIAPGAMAGLGVVMVLRLFGSPAPDSPVRILRCLKQ